MKKRDINKSAACGAWVDLDGKPAHRYCTGRVSLPPPNDVCRCECHKQEGENK